MDKLHRKSTILIYCCFKKNDRLYNDFDVIDRIEFERWESVNTAYYTVEPEWWKFKGLYS